MVQVFGYILDAVLRTTPQVLRPHAWRVRRRRIWQVWESRSDMPIFRVCSDTSRGKLPNRGDYCATSCKNPKFLHECPYPSMMFQPRQLAKGQRSTIEAFFTRLAVPTVSYFGFKNMKRCHTTHLFWDRVAPKQQLTSRWFSNCWQILSPKSQAEKERRNAIDFT